MQTPSLAATLASGVAIAGAGFLLGFSVSSATHTTPDRPLVDPYAWNQAAPPVETVKIASAPTKKCNSWDVSEAAMEEVLREMTRRGWRPPNQGDAIASLVGFNTRGISVDDPYAPMPSGSGGGTITVLSDEEAAQIYADETPVNAGTATASPEALPPS